MFEGWNNFYQITGGAAANLIGLLFVVVSLTNRRRERAKVLRAVSIYLTPTALHFAIVLSLSALAVAPRLPISAKAAVVGLGAILGLGHGAWACIGMRARSPGAEPPHWSDFWLYGAAPFVIYLALAVASVALLARADWAVHAMGAVLVALLILGIRNAWDLVTWLAPVADKDNA